MNNPLLIHIGYRKTATTWLQNRLFNRKDLGYISPWGLQSGFAADIFVHSSPFKFDATDAAKQFDAGIAEASRCACIPVISNEALCGFPRARMRYEKEVADRLHAAFPFAKILVTVREQKALLLSQYRSFVANGKISHGIHEYLGDRELRPGFVPTCPLDYYEYDLLVEYYRSLFGANHVMVLPQEQLRDDRQGFCDLISTFVGLERCPAPADSPDRIGLRGITLSFKRKCNRIGLGIPDWSYRNQSLDVKLVDYACRGLSLVTPNKMNLRLEQALKSAVDDFIGDYYAQSNARLGSIIGTDLRGFGYMMPD